MLDNVYVIRKQSQVKALGTELKLKIINNLIVEMLTCQQLADKLFLSKQKVHYNLKALLSEDLINQVNGIGNDKEKHYQAKARNYVIDFSLGKEIEHGIEKGNRQLITKIIEHQHGLDLGKIAEGIVKSSLKMKKREKLMVVTGRLNMPLVERIQAAVVAIGAQVTVQYRDKDFLRLKNEEFDLEAYKLDYANFNKTLSGHDVYLYLNGEARFIGCDDPEKRKIAQDSRLQSLKIIKEKGIRVAMMQGLLNNSLSEDNIKREINFWESLDLDYGRLRLETDNKIAEMVKSEFLKIEKKQSSFVVGVAGIFGEYGSFGDSPYQSSTINLPGGEVLVVPKPNSINGTIKGNRAFINGKILENPVVEIVDNRIVNFSASKDIDQIAAAITEGGEDGSEIALICIGTNYRMSSKGGINQFGNKSKGLLTVYWGDNRFLGGNVRGKLEWQIQIEKPKIIIKNKRSL